MLYNIGFLIRNYNMEIIKSHVKQTTPSLTSSGVKEADMSHLF